MSIEIPRPDRRPWSPKQLADAVGVHRRTASGWIAAGLIPDCFRTPGGHYRIPYEQVQRLLAKQKGETPQ